MRFSAQLSQQTIPDTPPVALDGPDRLHALLRNARRITIRLGDSRDPPASADLRRKRPRAFASQMVERAAWLPPAERALLIAAFRDNLPAKAIAHLLGESPNLVRRSLRNLVARVSDPKFEYVLRERDHWTTTRRRIATAVILHGRSMREAAAQLHLSLYLVRKEVHAIVALADVAA